MKTDRLKQWAAAGVLAGVLAGAAGCAPAPAPQQPEQPPAAVSREDALFDGSLPRLPRPQEQIVGAVAEQVAGLTRGTLNPAISLSTPTAEELAAREAEQIAEDRKRTEAGYVQAGMTPELSAQYVSGWEQALPVAEFPAARLGAVLYREPRIVHHTKGDTPGTGTYTVEAVVRVSATRGAPGNRDRNEDGFSVDFVGKWLLTFDEATNQVTAVAEPSVKDLAASVVRE